MYIVELLGVRTTNHPNKQTTSINTKNDTAYQSVNLFDVYRRL